MDASIFIASRLRFKGKVAMVCIAVSFLVMIIAVSISSGFRNEIRSSLSDVSGDILISYPDLNIMGGDNPITISSELTSAIRSTDEVSEIVPAVWRAGIVKHAETIHGVAVKGVPSLPEQSDSLSLGVSIPRSLAMDSGLKVGDKMLTYFIGEDMKLRQFNVVSIHETIVETDDRHIVYASLSDMQRLNGWSDDEVSAIELHLRDDIVEDEEVRQATQTTGFMLNALYPDGDLVATSSLSRFPLLFNWLELIDFNVGFILLLMTVVAGFNMISGLLIMLFENISTIGLLKSLGMTDKSIAKVFLSSSAYLVGKGMLIGNAIAVLFCLIQDTTHLLKLNPENYYVSFVPVNLDLGTILFADVLSFAVIMLLLLIPCLFISKVDPSETVRVR